MAEASRVKSSSQQQPEPILVDREKFDSLLGKMIQPAHVKRSDVEIDAKKPAKLIETAR